jgi:hypothetical protein
MALNIQSKEELEKLKKEKRNRKRKKGIMEGWE